MLRWFGHVQRLDEYRMVRTILLAEVSGRRVRSRPRLVWMNSMKVYLGSRQMTIKVSGSMREKFEGLQSACAYVES